jgi:NAD(P)-dependent dehydrogenase (short-subunit alcohol dehydrogenase family)
MAEGSAASQGSGKLAGKVALVTGAGSMGEGFGTGKAMSVLFAREGARLVLVDIDEGRAAETKRIIEEEGGEATIVLGDLSDPTVPARLVADAVAAYGRLDILVNNAALANPINFLKMDDAMLHKMVAINLTAPLLLCKAAIPAMIESGDGGSIINISSVASIRGQGGAHTVYAATKSAYRGMTVDLADAFGRDGIRVNTIAPGMITTPHRSHIMKEQGVEEDNDFLAQKTCLGIQGDSWDIARAALFLAGPDGRYITGVLLPVDGGVVARSH